MRAGYRYSGKANWSEPHQRYLRELTMPMAAYKAVMEEYLLALDQCCDRVQRLDELLEAQVPQWCHYPAVKAPMSMRGFQLIAATVLVAEIGDIHRFFHYTRISARSRFLGIKETDARLRRPCSFGSDVVFCRRRGGSSLIRFHPRSRTRILLSPLDSTQLYQRYRPAALGGGATGALAAGVTLPGVRSGALLGQFMTDSEGNADR